MIKEITSTQNSNIQLAVKLHEARERAQKRLFVAEGERTVSTLINAGLHVEMIFITEKMRVYIENHITKSIPFLISDSLMKKISKTTSPSGLLAVFRMPKAPKLSSLSSGVVLAGIKDPGNAGTLVRTAAAMNKKTAVFIDSVDPFNPKVVQASTGAVGLLNIFSISFEELIDNKGALQLVALMVSDGKNPRDVDLKDSLIVVGSEALGIDKNWVDKCEQKITLPMPGHFDSLNAGVAGSIAIYLSATKHLME
jgi:TrmH family RNA methyltransferase